MQSVPFRSKDLPLDPQELMQEVLFLRQQISEQRALRGEHEWHITRLQHEAGILRQDVERLTNELAAVAEKNLPFPQQMTSTSSAGPRPHNSGLRFRELLLGKQKRTPGSRDED